MSKTIFVFLLAALAAVTSGAIADDIFVSSASGRNNGSGTIGEYDATTGAPVNASLITGLGFPQFITASGQNLFVSDQSTATIGEYTTTGATVNASLVTGLNNPAGIAVSGNNLFVVNQNNNGINEGTIGEYNATTGAAVNPSLITGLNGPYGIAVSGGNLFVVTQQGGIVNGGKVTEYNATTGALVNASLVTGLNEPWGIAISGTSLFVTQTVVPYRVGEYTTSGTTIAPSLIMGEPPLSEPTGIAVSGGQLFAVNHGASTVSEFSTTGETMNASFITGPESFSPWGIVVVVPEPSSLVLAVLGSGVLAAWGWRCRNRPAWFDLGFTPVLDA